MKARELFVYYRVAEADAPRAEAVVRDMQAALMHEVPGLQARLLARQEPTNGELTWMETYAGPRGVDDVLQARIEAVARTLAPLLRSPRHVEAFIARE